MVSATFEQDFANWTGPEAGERAISLAEAEEYCRNLAKSHYENFPVVSWLLPRKLHQHFYNIYAYCRTADDLGDEIDGANRSLVMLDWWRSQLAACYEGSAQHPVFVALKSTIDEFAIPPQPFEDLIAAFEQDQRVQEYNDFPQLLDYCTRSANPVGVLVLYLCRACDGENVQWSDSICTGLQLANFWQDVARDMDMGRVYLPAADRERFGYGDDDLRHRRTNEAFIELMRFEVERAREYLLAGLPLVDRMQGRMQVDIDLFIRGGLKTLDRIEAIGYRVWDTRPVVSKRDFAGLFAKSVGRSVWKRLRPRRGTPVDHADHIEGAAKPR